jgi:hypothetical protein
MKAKTSDSNINCFRFPIGYSLSLANACTEDFVTTGFVVGGCDGCGISLTTPVP